MTNKSEGAPKLFTVPAKPRTRTSDVLLTLIEFTNHPKVTLRSLTERFGDRTFGMLLVLVAIFSVIPFVSLIVGPLITLLGLQMAVGLTKTWLPRSVLDWQLSPEGVRTALCVFEPRVRAIERYVRPRWQFTEAPIVDRINGLIIVVLGMIIALPIPLANLGPALVLVLLGLGIMERDGLVKISAACMGLATLSVVYYLVFVH
ncbi:exopolysaccharide biosynthesis protein [Zhongshania borealis]|uniref:Exopolysaccharide biosynthesis protein n=1 Tax=Zhongshania borealis TaxID=889488 RepID=A0ABP7WF14_9GAMM